MVQLGMPSIIAARGQWYANESRLLNVFVFVGEGAGRGARDVRLPAPPVGKALHDAIARAPRSFRVDVCVAARLPGPWESRFAARVPGEGCWGGRGSDGGAGALERQRERRSSWMAAASEDARGHWWPACSRPTWPSGFLLRYSGRRI